MTTRILPKCLMDDNKIANHIFCDVKYEIYEGVLYFPNITRLYETRINVTLFTPVRMI